MIAVQKIEQGYWAVVTDSYSVTTHRECKATPGMRWDDPRNRWWGRADAVEAAVARMRAARCTVIGDPTEPAAELQDAANWERIAKYAGMRNYQVEGWRFIMNRAHSGVLLSDDVGLGKTFTTLCAAHAFNERTVIVSAKFILNEWKVGITGGKKPDGRVIPIGWPNCSFEILEGTKPYDITATDAVIIPYSVVEKWTDALIAWKPKFLVIDECHYIISDTTKRSIAVKKVRRACDKCVAISATPKPNQLIDLLNVLDTLEEGRFGKKFTFGLFYCGGRQEQVTPERLVWNFKGSSHTEELNKRLSHLMVRRMKSDVALELPERERQIVQVDVSKAFAMAPMLAMNNDTALHKALELAAEGKIPTAIEMAATDVKAGHKVVIWCHRKIITETIAAGLVAMGVPDVIVSHGDIDADKRRELLEKAPNVVCATIDAHQAGIDMTFADIGIYAELIYEPHKIIQTEGRQHRFGAGRPVLFRYLIALGTIDEVIRDVCLSKLGVDEKVLGKADHVLDETFKQSKAGSHAAALKAMYERLMATSEDYDGRELELAAAINAINNGPEF